MNRDIKNQTSRPTGRRAIAVIGIDQYKRWPHLCNAVSDARGALKAFTRLGFECVTEPLYDEAATADAIRSLTTDKLSKLDKEDSLVLFFAGHGHTAVRTFQDGDTTKTGYIIPVDGDRNDESMARWLRLDSWLSDIARLEVKHILVFLDACQSGIALSSRWLSRGMKRPTESFERLARRRSRRVIASAQDDQQAKDGGPISQHSLFTGWLIRGLDGGIAPHGEFVTGARIGGYLQERVTEYADSCQTPCFGVFEEDKEGELIIQIVTTTAVQEAEEKARREAEERVRQEAEARARLEAAEKARQEAEARARLEAAEKARQEAAERARQEAEDQARRDAEARARWEAEARVRLEAAEKARQDAEERARWEAEARARLETEARARLEVAEKARREAEDRARWEAEARARLEAAEKARHEAEAWVRQEAEARVRLEAAEKARQDAESRARREAESRARQETESRARLEAAEKAQREAEERARWEAESRARQETESRARLEAAEKAQREAESRARREAESRAQLEAESRARLEAAETAQREAEGRARREAEARARLEAAERARREAESRARREAELRARQAAAERARQEAEGQARLAATEKAQREAETARLAAAETARREADEGAQRVAAEQARQEAEKKARLEAEEKARRDAEQQARQEAEKKARLEAEEKARLEAAERARRAAHPEVAWAPLDESLDNHLASTRAATSGCLPVSAGTAAAATQVPASGDEASTVSWEPLSSTAASGAGIHDGNPGITAPASAASHQHSATNHASDSVRSVTSVPGRSGVQWIPLASSEPRPSAGLHAGPGTSVSVAPSVVGHGTLPVGSRPRGVKRLAILFAVLCLITSASLWIYYSYGTSAGAQAAPSSPDPAPRMSVPSAPAPPDASVSPLAAVTIAPRFAIDVVVEQRDAGDARSSRVLHAGDDLRSLQKFAIRVRPSRAAFVYTFYCIGLSGEGHFHPLPPSTNPLPAQEFARTPTGSSVVNPRDVRGARTSVVIAVVASLDKIPSLEDSFQRVTRVGETAESVGRVARALSGLSSPQKVARLPREAGLAVCDRPRGIQGALKPEEVNALSVRYQAVDDESLIVATLPIGLVDTREP